MSGDRTSRKPPPPTFTLANGIVLSVDTEKYKTEIIQMDGIPAMLIQKDNWQQIIGESADKTVIAAGATEDALIRVAGKPE